MGLKVAVYFTSIPGFSVIWKPVGMECNIRQVFQRNDEHGNGVISTEEIRRVLRQNRVACGRTVSGLMNIGTLGSDSISFREFAAAVVEVSHAAGCCIYRGF